MSSQVKVINNERVIYCDIDDTLVMHGDWTVDSPEMSKELVIVRDPYSEEAVILKINNATVRLVKEEKVRGSFVIVHSAGGYRWAEAIVKVLGLENYVDLILTKPVMYIDDKPVEEWFGKRVYISHDNVYKTRRKNEF